MTSTRPATGTAAWITPTASGYRVLSITVETAAGPEVGHYEVRPTGPDSFTLYGLRLRDGKFSTYTVQPEAGLCSCPDAKHRRPGGCKHVRGLRAALARKPYHGYAG